MAFRNQQEFIDALEQAGELVRIKHFVDPKLEIAEITDRVSKLPGSLFNMTVTNVAFVIGGCFLWLAYTGVLPARVRAPTQSVCQHPRSFQRIA